MTKLRRGDHDAKASETKKKLSIKLSTSYPYRDFHIRLSTQSTVYNHNTYLYPRIATTLRFAFQDISSIRKPANHRSALQPTTMNNLYYHSSRTRERSPLFDDDEDFYASRRLVRTNSKRARADIYDDDEYDDYPYSNNKAKPSRALTIRQPSQLEKYNVWSRPSSSSPKHTSSKYYSKASDDEDDDHKVRYKYTTTRYSPARHSRSDDEDDREREFRLKVKATFGRPRSSHSSERKAMVWPSDVFRRKDKWIDEEWSTRERERGRRDSFFDDEPVKEKTVRFHRVKRTRTDEWKPLSGFRR